jgi:hypothetical protein
VIDKEASRFNEEFKAFFELHIEQRPVLVKMRKPFKVCQLYKKVTLLPFTGGLLLFYFFFCSNDYYKKPPRPTDDAWTKGFFSVKLIYFFY